MKPKPQIRRECFFNIIIFERKNLILEVINVGGVPGVNFYKKGTGISKIKGQGSVKSRDRDQENQGTGISKINTYDH